MLDAIVVCDICGAQQHAPDRSAEEIWIDFWSLKKIKIVMLGAHRSVIMFCDKYDHGRQYDDDKECLPRL